MAHILLVAAFVVSFSVPALAANANIIAGLQMTAGS